MGCATEARLVTSALCTDAQGRATHCRHTEGILPMARTEHMYIEVNAGYVDNVTTTSLCKMCVPRHSNEPRLGHTDVSVTARQFLIHRKPSL